MVFSKYRTDYSDIETFARCPSCQHLIKQKSLAEVYLEGSKNCPFCHVLIEKWLIIESCQMYLRTTKAVQTAGEILAMNKGLIGVFVMIFLSIGYIYIADWGKYNLISFSALASSVFILFGGLLIILNWLSVFGSIQTADEEFISVRKKVRQSQNFWVWANIINAVWWGFYIKFL